MELRSPASVQPYVTKDGSTIRELHHTVSQSLAEASLPPGGATQRHYHARSEEIYFILEGAGTIEVDGERRRVRAGDAVLIPPGARHTIAAAGQLRFLCCCSPPYRDEDTYFEEREAAID